jgi:hypothetical protein
MEREEDFNRYRFIYKHYIDEFYDDEVLELLSLFNNNEIKNVKNRLYYGKYLIKYEREW